MTLFILHVSHLCVGGVLGVELLTDMCQTQVAVCFIPSSCVSHKLLCLYSWGLLEHFNEMI